MTSPSLERETRQYEIAENGSRRTRLRTWLGFLAMCTGMFMAILDIQIVVTALPAIRKALNIPPQDMSWVQTSYLIAEVIAIALTGIFTRAFSIRGLFLIALTVFTLASIACAFADGFWPLIAARIVQGFAGGCLIPLVFTSVFLLFNESEQGLATTIAGGLAVLAPTLGPTVGGYITQTYDWPWLFLINVGPGAVSLVVGWALLPRGPGDLTVFRSLDRVALIGLVVSLAALEIGLKEAPKAGWLSPPTGLLFSAFLLGAVIFAARSLLSHEPFLDLRLLRTPNTAAACIISFVFGAGLFASIYLMVVFLGLVRLHDPLEIGLIIIVTGIAQLCVAPLVVQLELRVDARILTLAGLLLFGGGLLMSAGQTRQTDYDEMFWPQVVRGIGIMLCLIPPTRLALDHLSERQIPDGSALFNVLRNIGGAIGIAMVDTILWQRGPIHAEALGRRLASRDPDAIEQVGIPTAVMPPPGVPLNPSDVALARPLLERAGLVEAINEAWWILAIATFAAIAVLPLARGSKAASSPQVQR